MSQVQWATATEILELIARQKIVLDMMGPVGAASAAAAMGFTKTASGMYVKTVLTTTAAEIAGTTAIAAAPSAARKSP